MNTLSNKKRNGIQPTSSSRYKFVLTDMKLQLHYIAVDNIVIFHAVKPKMLFKLLLTF